MGFLNSSKLQTIFCFICSYLPQKIIFNGGVSNFVTVNGSSKVKIFFKAVGKHLTVILTHKFGQFRFINVSNFENIYHHHPVSIRFLPRFRKWPDHLIPSAIALTPSLHLVRSTASSIFNPTSFTLSSGCFLHVIFDRPRFRFPFTSSIISFGILSSSLLIICPYQWRTHGEGFGGQTRPPPIKDFKNENLSFWNEPLFSCRDCRNCSHVFYAIQLVIKSRKTFIVMQ